jgi:hypothetical protein
MGPPRVAFDRRWYLRLDGDGGALHVEHGRRSRRRAMLLVTGAAVVVLAAFVILRVRGSSRAGSEVRVTLQIGVLGPDTAWVDPSSRQVWCLAPGQNPPRAAGSWSDGIEHGGARAIGTLRLDDDDHAIFVADSDGGTTTLQRGGKFGC